MNKKRPILIQGAMQVEIEYLIKQIKNPKKVDKYGYEFYEGEINESSSCRWRTSRNAC